MEPNPQNSWDALSESAKAFANIILGENQTDVLRENLVSYSQLESENRQLKVEVASLKETLPFKDKYENLSKEFRKVAAERDSLSSQRLKFNHMSADYDRMKSAYQKTKGQLAALEDQLKTIKQSSTDPYSLLESLYQAFKEVFNRYGVETRRIPARVSIQVSLEDDKHTSIVNYYRRVSRDKWTKLS